MQRTIISIKSKDDKQKLDESHNIILYDLKQLKNYEEWQYGIYIMKLYLDKIQDNDIIIYCKNINDIIMIKDNIDSIFEKLNRDIIFPIINPTLFLNRVTNNTIFTILGENNDYYKNYFLLSTDIILIKKTHITIKFINELYNLFIHYKMLGVKSHQNLPLTLDNIGKIITSILYRKYMKEYLFNDTLNLYINKKIQFVKNLPFVNSFDIFDTIVTRNVMNPTDIFDIIEEKYPFPKFKIFRLEAEKKNGVTLDSIYNEFKLLTNITDDEIDNLKKYEIQTEINNLYLINSIYNLINDNDILISDIYFNPEQLKFILKSIGYNKNTQIFSSSCGLSKINEQLYRHVQTIYNIKLHIGDNKHSDIINAQLNNINTCLTNIHNPIKVEEFFIKKNFKDFGLLLRRMRLLNPYLLNTIQSKLYNDQATYNIPLLILISQNINQIMVKENRDTLLCLTRDGCLLEHMFKLLYPHYKCIKYYSSRKLHTEYNEEYINYIKENYNHQKCIMFDGHGSFKSGRQLYNKVFGYLPRIFIFTYDLKDELYDGLTFGCSFSNDFEHINSDIEGSVISITDGKVIRDELEYDYNHALIYKNTILEFCNLIKNNNYIIPEMPIEFLKTFSETFVIASSIKYNTPQEGVPMIDYLKANNIDPVEWAKKISVY